MSYPFKFPDVREPALAFGARRTWDGLSAAQVRATAGRHDGGIMPDHRLIFYFTRGVTADCACEGARGRRILDSGDFDLAPAGAHGFWEDSEPVDLISVRLSRELVSSVAEALEMPADQAELAPKLGARDTLVDHVVRALAAELRSPVPAGRLYADSLASALAVRLLQDFAPVGAAGRQTLSKPQLRRIVEYVEAHLDADLTLADVATVAGISVPHLTTLFRRTMGQSVHAYVMERRVCHARALLLEGRTNIAEAALETGFAHQSHLARWMRRLLGVTPAQLLRS